MNKLALDVGAGDVTVLAYNLYLGADLAPVLLAGTDGEFLPASAPTPTATYPHLGGWCLASYGIDAPCATV